jgi:hypothetical protein
MRFFAPPTVLELYSNFSPDQCASLLSAAIDSERPSLFSISGYRGYKFFLGAVEGLEFRLLQRTYYRNSFPPVLSGQFRAHGHGTRVEGTFDLELTSKIAICVILGFGLLIIPAIWMAVRARGNILAAAAIAIGYAVLALFAPRIIRGLGLPQERAMTDFLCTTLQAGEDRSAF